MLGINNYAAFVVGTILTAIVPGANTYRVLEGVYKHGVKGGVAATTGVMAADVTFMIAAALGLGAMLKLNPSLFIGLLIIGAVYFGHLGYLVLRHAGPVKGLRPSTSGRVDDASGGIFTSLAASSFFTCVANFKAIFFYALFLPQFIDPAYEQSWLPLLVLFATCFIVLLTYYGSLCLIGIKTFSSPIGLKAFQMINVAFGVFVLILAGGMIREAYQRISALVA